MHPGVACIVTVGAGDIQSIYVALKALSARNVVDYIE